MDIWQMVTMSFFSGIGTGMANWLLIKRLEHVEKKILGKRKRRQQ